MKTIRLIVLAALLLPALVSQAQTKEETIAWLKEKLGNYSYLPLSSYNHLKLIDISSCEIIYSYKWGEAYTHTLYIPLQNCVINSSGYFDKFPIKAVKDFVKDMDNEPSHPQFLDTISQIKIENREENIYERIQKAIDHLATFCPKKTETF